MPGLPQVTVVGTLTADVELRYTSTGTAVASFTIAANDRKYDQATKSWKDGDATFLRCTLWREAAENAAEGLTRGTRVLAIGSLRQRSFENREGEKKTVLELDVDELGPSVKWASVKVARPDRSGGGSGGGAKAQAADDPWGGAPAASGGELADTPPF
jgi:single-strand DNA-binding protein